ncbi:hypothetical protein AB0D97_36125 [Streptomyces roseus]|uniref:hypothetical protein n=1 Tax=Streptomyces roseus TaxID=66430 RepID=UPI0033ED9978
MMAARALAETVISGSFMGVRPGVKLAEVQQLLPFKYVEEIHGRRRGSRAMRLDYGLLEVTFGNEPDWTCRSLQVEVHRLAGSPAICEEARALAGLEFAPYTPWSDVKGQLDVLGYDHTINASTSPGYQVFGLTESGVSLRVVNDVSCPRGEYPGHGDIWSLEIVRYPI